MIMACAIAVIAAIAHAVPSLTGRTSMPQSIFAIGSDAEMFLEAEGLTPGERRELSIVLQDERDRVVGECANDGIVADGEGRWKGTFTLPTDRLGFRRVIVKSGDLTLPKCGSRPKGCLTYAIVPDPAKRPPISQEDAFFGLQGHGSLFCGWAGVRNLFSTPPPSTNVTKCAETVRNYLERDVPIYSTIAAEERFVKPFMTREAADYFATRAKTVRRMSFSIPEGDAEGERHFRETVRAFAEAAKASRPYRRIYEYAQECDIRTPDPETMVRSQKAFYETVHEVDPEAIVTAAGMSNVTRPKQNFMRQLFELGIADYMDAFSLHPYTPYPPDQNGFVENIRAFVEMVRKYKGPDTMMVATEAGFAAPASDDVKQMDGNIRVALMLLGEGFSMHLMFWTIDFGNDDRSWSDGDYGLNYNLDLDRKLYYSTNSSPRPVFPALAAATLLIDGKRPVTSIENLGATAFGYAYADKADNCAIALWDYGNEPRDVTLEVGCEEVDVADIMGNVTRVKSPGGKLKLTLTSTPVYVIDPDPALWGARGSMRRKMVEEREARRRREEEACKVKVISATPAFFGGVPGVRVEVENRTPSNRVFTVGARIRGIPEARRSAETALPAHGRGEVAIPFASGVKLDPSVKQKVEIVLDGKDGYHATETVSFNFLGARRAPESVGSAHGFADWTTSEFFAWPGGDPGPVRMALGWNSRHLLADIEVRDDIFRNGREGFMAWAGDCIQLGLAKAELAQSSGNFQTDMQEEAMSEITLAMTSAGPSAYRTITFDPARFPGGNVGGEIPASDMPREITVVTNASGVVLRYRAAIPWRFLNIQEPVEGQVVRMGAFANDLDENPSMTALKFHKWFDLKDAKKFAHVVLCGDAVNDGQASGGTWELGQSQTPGQKPVQWTACEWCVDDGAGNVYLPGGWRVRRGMRTPEKCVDEVPGRKFSDGRGHIWSWDVRTGKLLEVRVTDNGLFRGATLLKTKAWQGCRFFAAPPGAGGWTDCAAFGMVERTGKQTLVKGFKADGTPLGTLLDCRAAGLTNVLCAAFHPVCGDLLVSVGWPQRRVHRFVADGGEITTGVWPYTMPYPSTATGFGTMGGDLFLCGSVVEREPTSLKAEERFRFDCPGGDVLAMADGGDGWWFATSNGALHFRKDAPSHCDARIGGVAKPNRICIEDGRVRAEIGNRVYAFWMDDQGGEPPSSFWLEPKTALPPDAKAESNEWKVEYDASRFAIRVTRKRFQGSPDNRANP